MSRGQENPVAAQELAAVLPTVLAAPRESGVVRLSCVRPEPNARTFAAAIRMTRATGVTGDFEHARPWLTLADGSPDPRNQASIMSTPCLSHCLVRVLSWAITLTGAGYPQDRFGARSHVFLPQTKTCGWEFAAGTVAIITDVTAA